MPMPDLPVPAFPDVPLLPGVPPLLRSATAQVGASINGLLISAGLGQFALGLGKPVWGVFDDNNQPVAIADSVRSLEYQGDSRVSDYPQEQGAFESYNKVQLPYNVRVALTCGGTVQKRAAFISAIDAAKQSTDLYTVVTPEVVYSNANIVSVGYRREARNGANLITAELHIEEIRQSATAAFAASGAGGSATSGSGAPAAFGSASALPASQVQNPASADTVSQGQVQAVAPASSQQAALQKIAADNGLTVISTPVTVPQ